MLLGPFHFTPKYGSTSKEKGKKQKNQTKNYVFLKLLKSVYNDENNQQFICAFSVEGLNFDFLSLNVVGFTLYSCYNCGIFFSEAIQVSVEIKKGMLEFHALLTSL